MQADQPIVESIQLHTFQGYPSIQLSTNKKFINRVYQSKYDDPSILWVATEKIHGANFSIHYDTEKDLVRYGRRNDFISKVIPVSEENLEQYFVENFFNAHLVVEKFHSKLILIKQRIMELFANQEKKKENDSATIIKSFHIFGEYFGGSWPKGLCLKRVQPGVQYTPNHEFMAFDIRIMAEGFNTWINVTDIPQILNKDIKYVPIYAQGTMEQLLKIPSEFDSTIPELLGLEKLTDNICQGLVIRPNKNLKTNSRVMIKKKNKEFLEKTGGNVKTKNKKPKLEKSQATPYLEFLEDYLNENRVESSISKFPDFKDRYHLKGYVIQDIMTDAKKDEYTEPQESEIKKQVHREFDKMVLTFVSNYLNKRPK